MFSLDKQYELVSAKHDDVDSWMRLVYIVQDDFPGLIIDEYRQTLIKNITIKSAICVKYKNEVVGVLLFSTKNKTLSCMAVHPAHRKKGIAAAMITEMVSLFSKGSEIWVSTFREDDPKGDAPRALYKKTGFVEDELTIEFEYPVQKFVLRT